MWDANPHQQLNTLKILTICSPDPSEGIWSNEQSILAKAARPPPWETIFTTSPTAREEE
jgi:hypothetical protein